MKNPKSQISREAGQNPNKAKTLYLPLQGSPELQSLQTGDKVLLSGTLYTARDQAHKKLAAALVAGKKLPFNPAGQALYYVGPTPARPGRVIGAAGPTTASRMDAFAPTLYDAGIKITIGKGNRSSEVVASCKKNGAVYLVATGGAGALLSTYIKSAKIVAFPELGPEAIYRLEVKNFPAIVAIDAKGNNLFRQ
ncbi:MAG: FumA C-terminus/TtdB family hydratase beta subunit [Candidatus Margulisiibacteriota bacterium]